MKESRLIYRTLSDYDQTLKLNSRNAQTQSDLQNANASTKGVREGSNPNADIVERMVQTNFDPAIHTPQEIKRQAAGTALADASNYVAAPGYNPAKGAVTEASTVYDAAAKNRTVVQDASGTTALGGIEQSAYDRLVKSGMNPAEALKKIQDPAYKQGISQAMDQVGTSSVQSKLQALDNEYANLTAHGLPIDPVQRQKDRENIIKAAEVEEMTRTNDLNQKTFDTEKGKTQENQGAMTSEASNKTKAIDIALAGMGPEGQLIGAALKETLAAQDAEKTTAKDNYDLEIKAADDQKSAYDEVLNEMKANAESFKAAADSFIETTQKNREEALAREKKNAAEQLEFQMNKQTREARQALDKQINSMVAAQALSGGFGSSNWTAEIADAEWRGEQTILDMQTEFGFKMADVDIAYTEDMNNLYEFFGEKKLAALESFQARKEGVSEYRFAAAEKTDARKTKARQELNTVLAGIAKEQAAATDKATERVLDAMNKQRDDTRAQEKEGWDRLEYAIKTYGSYAPPALLDSIAKQLPGIDVRSVAEQMTLAEMKQFKVKNAGGIGGVGNFSGGGGAHDPTGIASNYANMSPQDLKGAIDRAMLKFGGTGAERARKTNEYMNRVASGENTGTIISDLIKDYWATTTGTNETAHNQRTAAAANMEAILGYTDAYGLSEDNDGSLGALDSRVEWVKSFFGAASDEYNDINSLVSNIKGQITKANAGTAVSTYELQLLKEYLPSMDLKGPTFFANTRNYKALVNYLDAKQAAVDLGLPLPAIPKPITMTGNAVTGPGKYSDQDILSALSN